MNFSPSEVLEAIGCLKTGKSAGLDDIYSEHLKYASVKVTCIVSMFFNACISHNYLPVELIDTLIVPIVKDKKSSITDMDNYRPIAITCILSKLFEILILTKFGDKLYTADNQFGFKAKHSTDMAVFVFKQVVEFYSKQSSPVYICYLDASKAFDRINHWILFDKLLTRNVPDIIVRLIVTWYTCQRFYILWGNTLSLSFKVTNGVRQGGILSPYLFNVYIDELSLRLLKSKAGCHVNGTCVNHFVYADDCVILAPSPHALQKLLTICDDFAHSHEILYNVKKTVCMSILPKCLSKIYVPKLYLNGMVLNFVTNEKYLGVFISNDLYDDSDIQRQTRSIYARGNSLVRKFRNCSDDIKRQLFKSYCNALYCAQLWCRFKVANMSKVKSAFKRIYKYLLVIKKGSITADMLQHNCDPFDVLVRKLVYGFRTRLFNSDNGIVKLILNCNGFNCSQIFKCWKKILF